MKKEKKGLYSTKFIKEILKARKLDVLWKVFTSVLLRGILLISPILYSKAIDLIPEGQYNLAIHFLILTFFATALHYIFEYINEHAYYNLYNKLHKDLGWSIIKMTQGNSAYSLSRFSLGEYSNMLNSDVNIIADFLDSTIIRIVKVFEFLVIYAYFFSLNKIVFIVSILISLLAILMEFLRGHKVEEYNLKRKGSFDGYLTSVNDIFLGMKEIKGLHILDRVKNKFDESSDNYLDAHKEYNLYYKGGKFFIVGFMSCVRYFLLIYGVYLISIGQFQLGMIVLINNYYAKIVENFGEICTMSVEFRNFKVSLKRLDKVFEYANINVDYKVNELDESLGVIKFDNVLYGDKKDPILNKVSFTVKPDTINIITGKVGSGKSGIFDLLMRINRQHEGKITISDIDINEIDENLYFQYISLVRKDPTFFEMSIMDNLKLILDNEKKIKDVCKMLEIDDDIKKLSKGYNTSINSREVNTELKKMLGIARAFVKNTTIMLFDEIIDGLDDDNKDKILEILKEYKNNHTIMIITKSPDLLDFGDQLITLERNSIEKIKKYR